MFPNNNNHTNVVLIAIMAGHTHTSHIITSQKSICNAILLEEEKKTLFSRHNIIRMSN